MRPVDWKRLRSSIRDMLVELLILASLVLVVVAVLGILGCDAEMQRGRPAPDCFTENDCADVNACISGECVEFVPQACCSSASSDCDVGWQCDALALACTLPCEQDYDCAAVLEWTCDEVRGVCVWPCGGDVDCNGGECIAGICGGAT